MYQAILKKALRPWYLVGHHPERLIEKAVIISLVFMSSTMALAIYQMAQVKTGASIVTSTYSCCMIAFAMIYWNLLVTKKQDMISYIGLVKRFYDIESDLTSQGIISRNTVLKFTGSVCNTIISYCAPSICFYLMSIYFMYQSLPRDIPGQINFILFACHNNVTVIFTLCIIISAYCFTFCNIMFLITQFKLLNKAFLLMNYKVSSSPHEDLLCLKKIRNYIEHHHFLLRCCEDFSKLIGFSYVQLMPLMTIMLFLLAYVLATQKDLLLTLRSLLYVIGFVLTYLLMCYVPSKYLSAEISNISDSIYFSNWYNCRQPSIIRSLLIIMTRSQKPTVISFRNYAKMDPVVFISTIKVAFSVYTFLQETKN